MTKTFSDDEAARLIAKLTAKLSRGGRKDLADRVLASVQPVLAK